LSSLAISQIPTSGTATANSDGTVTSVHNGSAGATDSFKYTIADNRGTVSAAAQVTIAINQRPTAVADSAALATGATTTVNVATNDSDSDGTLNLTSIVITQQPAHGTTVVNANGTVTYLHDNSAATTDSFSYKISDNLGAQSAAAAIVSIAISAPEGEGDLLGGLTDDEYYQAVDTALGDEEDWTM
jgi:hypothetical protein